MSGPNVVPWGGDAAPFSNSLAVYSLEVSGGVGFVLGDVGYIHTDGTVRLAKDDGAATAEGEVVCLAATIADGASGYFLVVPGVVSGLSGGTAGSLGYVSNTAGGITTTAPSTAGRFSKILGRWLTTTVFLFNPDRNTYPIY